MDRLPPTPAIHVFQALFIAVCVATAAKAGLILVVPHLLQSSVSALTGNLYDARDHWELIKPLALTQGVGGAIACLVPALLLALWLRAKMFGYVLAGAVGETLHNALATILLEPAVLSLDRDTIFSTTLLPASHVLQGPTAIALASIVAGMLAGAEFAVRVIPEEQAKSSYFLRPAFLISTTIAAIAGWLLFHDREGERVCPHSDMARLAVGRTVYTLPATMQPMIAPLDTKKLPHIFNPGQHVYSNSAVSVRYRMVYCQTAVDAPWQSRGFAVYSQYLPSAPAVLPKGIRWISIYAVKAITPPTSQTVIIHPPRKAPGLEWLPDDPVIYGMPLGEKYGIVSVGLRDGNLMSAEMDFDFSKADSDDKPFRALGGFIAAYGRPAIMLRGR